MWREPLGFGVFVLVVAGLALTEYTGIMLAGAPRRLRVVVIAIGVGLAAGIYQRPEFAFAWVLGAVLAVSTAVLLEHGEMAGAGARLGAAGFGVFYLGA